MRNQTKPFTQSHKGVLCNTPSQNQNWLLWSVERFLRNTRRTLSKKRIALALSELVFQEDSPVRLTLAPFLTTHAKAANRYANGPSSGKAILALSLPPAAFIVTKTNNHPLHTLFNANAFTILLVKLSFLASVRSCLPLTLRILSHLSALHILTAFRLTPTPSSTVCHRCLITRNSGNFSQCAS